MIQTIRKAWGIPELRKKIIFTLLILLIFRIGNAITVPYVDVGLLETYLDQMGGTILGLYNVMSGGAFAQATVFALSIQPYINASIIIQLLTVAIPALERLAKDGGEEGRKKIQSITRYTTVGIAILQAVGYYFMMRNYNLLASDATGIWPALVIVVSFIAGSSFVMWMGEQVTEFGIGNGISLIIFAGIVARFPDGCMTVYKYIQAGSINIFQVLLFALIALFMIVVVIEVTQGQRRVVVQYAKRIVGRKMYGGHSTHIPLKVNQAGVIPIIFASSVLMFPITIAQFVQNETVQMIAGWFAWGTVTNTIMYAILIIFFTYFYTAISLNIPQLTENMQKYGGFIPGIRPGQPTALYIDRIMTRITLAGSFFLAFIAILPNFIGWITGIEGVYFGGTALLIVVGVAIDTMKQAESLLLNRQYQGFMK